MAQCATLALAVSLLLLLLALPGGRAVKLRFRIEECVFQQLQAYEAIYGSFVSLNDVYGVQAHYDLRITSPSGMNVHQMDGLPEGSFTLITVRASPTLRPRSPCTSSLTRQQELGDMRWANCCASLTARRCTGGGVPVQGHSLLRLPHFPACGGAGTGGRR